MSRADANVFVVHSRFQLVVVQHMLLAVAGLRSRDNHLILDMPAAELPVDPTLWASVVALAPPIGGRVVGKGMVCRRAMRTVSALVAPYERLTLFVSDIQWPLNNALYATLVRRGRAALACFPDGIGSLQIVYPSIWQRAKDFAKALLGLVGGVPYRPYRGDIMGLERSEQVYSLLPDALPSLRDRTLEIPRRHVPARAAEDDSVLFLGQNYESFVPPSQYAKIVISAAQFTRSLGFNRLLYKPHPLERDGCAMRVFREQGFEVVCDSRTVEEMFLERQTACVVSYNSSALVHLKLLFGDAVRCVAVHNEAVLRHTNVEASATSKMEALFALCGVESHA